MNEDEELVVPEWLYFLEGRYRITGYAGDGTFSTVYKAIDLYNKNNVALKVVTRTSAPNRILTELNILKVLNGQNNCIKLLDILREFDQIVMVFPLVEHIDFKDFLVVQTPLDVKKYMYQLIKAVAHMHRCNIIHRDIKPGNFLFNKETGEGCLIDFGLAQYEKPKPITLQQQQRPLIFFNSIINQNKPPGYYEKDTRPALKAPRSGTRGFRAPEVLFKYPDQTRAIDIWSCGVVLITILTEQYPFFYSVDDIDGLAEMGILFGSSRMRKAAKSYGRTWKTNLQTIDEVTCELDELVAKFTPNIDPLALDLLNKMMELVASRRITAEEALIHPYFSDLG